MPAAVEAGRPVRRIRPGTYLFFFAAFALIVFLTHLPYFNLPLYWDELGQFVPAALDLFREGRWVPHSAVPNVHPPGLMAYLAGVWNITGYSIPATRAAMLAVASLSVLLVFLLANHLCRSVRGTPGLSAVLLLGASPLFYTQAMMAQLDLPSMLFTVWALLWFVQARFAGAALVATALVLVKETGVVVPAVFALWLWRAGKPRQALYFLLPFAALAGWLAVLAAKTGHIFGNSEFTDYNFFYPLHPVRVGVALLRRFYYLFLGGFHWIGWIAVALAWRRSRIYSHEAWRVTAAVAAAQVAVVSVFGGATLERYLLPVIPLMYIAMAAAFAVSHSRWMRLGQAAMTAGLFAGLFINPLYPFPYENNLAIADFVRLQQSAASFLEQHFPGRTVTTAWPLSAALRRPEYGYVGSPVPVKRMANFGRSDIEALGTATPDIFVLYSKEWDPALNLWRVPQFRALQTRFYGYEPQIPPDELQARFHLTPVAQWTRRGQSIAVFVRQR